MTKEELREAVAKALLADPTSERSQRRCDPFPWDTRVNAAITVVLEATCDAIAETTGEPGDECYGRAHAAIENRIRALMPEGSR